MPASSPSAPVIYEPNTGQWFVTGYDEVRSCLADERLTSDRMYRFEERSPAEAVEAVRRNVPWLISRTDRDYSWITPLVHTALRRTASAEAEQAMRTASDQLLNELLRHDDFDIVGDYALPLAGWMLADFVGAERVDGERIMEWALMIVPFFQDPNPDVLDADRMAVSMRELMTFLFDLWRSRGADERGVFVMDAEKAAAQSALPLDDETIANIVLPFVTGQVGVARLVANTAWLLLENGQQLAALKCEPDLLGGAIAESLRHTPPSSLVSRVALEEVEVGGCVVQDGQVLQLDLAAANADPDRFPDPERYDITRRQAGALGFGRGPHSCVGAGLARIQAAAAVGALISRADELRLDRSREVWTLTPGIGALEAVRVNVSNEGLGR